MYGRGFDKLYFDIIIKLVNMQDIKIIDKYGNITLDLLYVYIGLPDSDNLTVVIQTEDGTSVFPPGDCDSTPPLAISSSSDSADVTITSSVLSAPGVNFTVDGELVSADCHPDGQCPGEVRCSMEVQHTIDVADPRDINISISYEDVEPWTFCIRPGKLCV